ncbi:MAG: DUF4230 domain-containing protein [Vicinamibacterales bacterium]
MGSHISTPAVGPEHSGRGTPAARWVLATGSTTSGFLVGFVGTALLTGLSWWLLHGATIRIDTSRPAVIHRIQRLQRLETVVYEMDKIVAGGQESRYWPTFLAGDRLLLVVHGEVSAGVDLGKIDAAQIEVGGRRVQLRMPPAELFATRIDNERTRVYSRETGLFTRPDPNLESDVRLEAERQIRQAALDGGVLESAATNARATLLTFLQGLGFDHVDIR